jgi:hypothetical protein
MTCADVNVSVNHRNFTPCTTTSLSLSLGSITSSFHATLPHTGHIFQNLGAGLFPAVGLRSPGESLSINLTGPFKYDIDSHVKRIRDDTWHEAKSYTPKQSEKAVNLVEDISDSAQDTCVSGSQGPIGQTRKADNLPEISPLHDGLDKSAASFVLDYLKHNGHNKVLDLVKNEMVEREWLPSNIASSSSSSKTIPDVHARKLRLSDFETIDTALIWLETVINDDSVGVIPWGLISDLRDTISRDKDDVEREKERLYHLLKVDEFVRVLSTDNEENGIGEEALECGRRLLSVSEKEDWEEEERMELKEAFGLIAVAKKDWYHGKREEKRRALAKELVHLIRRESFCSLRGDQS